MTPFLSHDLAQALRNEDLARAERSRLRRAARSGFPGLTDPGPSMPWAMV